MKKTILPLLCGIFLCILVAIPGQAQSEELKLTLSRDWGYGGFNNDIQGLFSMHVVGPENIIKVEFYIDDQIIGEDSEAPFSLQFTTDTYSLGVHSLHAIGFTPENKTIRSNILQANFVSASEGTDAAVRIVGPILGVVLVAIFISVGIPLITTRGKKESLPLGEGRNYGFRGGGICPKCKRPFALHVWGMNLGFSKLDRCPYCGKWSIVGVKSMEKLREAERAELTWGQMGVPEISQEEKLRKEIDDSKYQA